MRVAGSRPQGPVGQVSRGLGARAPRAWGPARQGPGAFSPQKPPKPLKLRFFRKPPGGSLAKAWVSAETAASEVGTWRETKPGYAPYPTPLTPARVLGFSPSPPSASIQHAPQGRRIKPQKVPTLSKHAHIHIYIYISTYTYFYTYICLCVCTCMHIWISRLFRGTRMVMRKGLGPELKP